LFSFKVLEFSHSDIADIILLTHFFVDLISITRYILTKTKRDIRMKSMRIEIMISAIVRCYRIVISNIRIGC
jgi:hypothetical protein